MKEYLENPNFLILLKSMNIDIANTDEESLKSLYKIYQDNTNDFTKKMVNAFNTTIYKKDLIDCQKRKY